MKKTLITGVLAMLTVLAYAQERSFSLPEAIDAALKNNSSIRTANYEAESKRTLAKKTIDLPKTDVTLLYGQYNSYAKNDNNISVTQSIPFTVFGSQNSFNRALSKSMDRQKIMTENEIVWEVKRTYFQLLFQRSFNNLLQKEDSIYQGFVSAASVRYRTGESRLLQKSTAEEQLNEVKIRLGQNEVEVMNLRSRLKYLINADELPDVANNELKALVLSEVDTAAYLNSPSLSYAESQINVSEGERKLQQARFAPDFQVGIFSQTLIGAVNTDNGREAGSGDRFTGIQLGLSLPLWFGPHRARVRAAELNRSAAESRYSQLKKSIQVEVEETVRQVSVHRKNLDFYETSALPNAERILKQSQIAFREGEIDYPEFLLGLRTSISVRENYLKTLNDYNQQIIYLEYLTGQK